LATSLHNQVIALAGVAQAAQLVDQIARTGATDDAIYQVSIDSLFDFDPKSTESVFGGLQGVGLGLSTLQGILTPASYAQLQMPARYLSGMIFLERKLANNPDMMKVIHSRLEHTAYRAAHFNDDPTGLSSAIAAIYQDTISQFQYRIHVSGDADHLRDTHRAERIRALLLAGIRAAMLWRQVGGKRWQLLLRKNTLQQTVIALRQQITH
jgi:high frequency lysogenization protein